MKVIVGVCVCMTWITLSPPPLFPPPISVFLRVPPPPLSCPQFLFPPPPTFHFPHLDFCAPYCSRSSPLPPPPSSSCFPVYLPPSLPLSLSLISLPPPSLLLIPLGHLCVIGEVYVFVRIVLSDVLCCVVDSCYITKTNLPSLGTGGSVWGQETRGARST